MVADERPDAIDRAAVSPPRTVTSTPTSSLPSTVSWLSRVGIQGPDSADLGAAERERIASAAVPVPEGVSKGVVWLADDRRFDVPVLLVCPEYGPEDAKAWIDAGDVPELTRANRVDFEDIDSGHWPMVTRPAELAGILAAAASEG